MICLVVAWMAEAQPLVERYRLKLLSRKFGFRIYRNAELVLVVTGQGKAAAAAGIAWVRALLGDNPPEGWVNVGIAGHRELAVGAVVVAARIEDRCSGKYWRMTPLPIDVPDATIVTVPVADTRYGNHAVVEMEASGFVETSLRFSDQSKLACIKVIADNKEQPADASTPGRAAALMAEASDQIEEIIGEFRRRNYAQ